MIPENVDRLYILKTVHRETRVIESHLAYFVPSSEPFAVYACNEEPVAVKVECDSSRGLPADERDMDMFDQYCNEVTCEKCLAIARGEQ